MLAFRPVFPMTFEEALARLSMEDSYGMEACRNLEMLHLSFTPRAMRVLHRIIGGFRSNHEARCKYLTAFRQIRSSLQRFSVSVSTATLHNARGEPSATTKVKSHEYWRWHSQKRAPPCLLHRLLATDHNLVCQLSSIRRHRLTRYMDSTSARGSMSHLHRLRSATSKVSFPAS